MTGSVVAVVNSSGFSRRLLLICSYTEYNTVSTPREFVPGVGGIPRSRDEIYCHYIPIALATITDVDESPTGLGLG